MQKVIYFLIHYLYFFSWLKNEMKSYSELVLIISDYFWPQWSCMIWTLSHYNATETFTLATHEGRKYSKRGDVTKMNCPKNYLYFPLRGTGTERGGGSVLNDSVRYKKKYFFNIPINGTVKILDRVRKNKKKWEKKNEFVF